MSFVVSLEGKKKVCGRFVNSDVRSLGWVAGVGHGGSLGWEKLERLLCCVDFDFFSHEKIFSAPER